ncbi:DoxX family protein [Lewinella sp. IMCC34191]|uniref:DoxX family protein n=1 Tax=Lewinella sp. IMCC34191 TaxID=2259172 RepID=UPI000E233466|nr:DoxX family protein [Lewinella sp. IMCC34191]
MEFSTLATFFSGISFVGFGISCQTSAYMKQEFIRYGYDRQRPLTGYLQILGGIGLIAGYYFSPLLAMAAATGLCLMMAYGFGVRMYIRDTFLQATPAFLYAVLNGYLAFYYGGLL